MRSFDEVLALAKPELVRRVASDPLGFANRVIVVTDDGVDLRYGAATPEQMRKTSIASLTEFASARIGATSSPVLVVRRDMSYVFADFEWAT